MTLAFMPFGALLAGLFHGSAVTLFALVVGALDRGACGSAARCFRA